jgi:hypothetical protein
MADMQVAIGFRRKSRDDFIVFTGLEVTHDNVANKIGRWRILVVIQWNRL